MKVALRTFEGGQQKTKRMPNTGGTVSSAAASKSSPPDSLSKSDVDNESASDSDASMITASTKLYKRKRQLEGEAQSSSDSDDTEDSGGKFKCVRLVNTIVLVNVKIGRGASATTHPCQFRVTALYDKWYNKYVMSKEPFKR